MTSTSAGATATSQARLNIGSNRISPSVAQIALALIVLKSKPVELSIEGLPTLR
jgi:hypothetical protein